MQTSMRDGMDPQARRYESYVMWLAPLLNSVSGIAVDLFAPSMPSIAQTFGVDGAIMQTSISVMLIAYAFGQLVFGLVADGRGRLAALYPGLALFVAGSVVAMTAHGIAMFLVGRALQGFSVGACQVCARALVVDNVKGERFTAAVVYLSLAWGLGPVIAPFVGGLVEQYAGWRWNFALYAAYGALLLLLSSRLRESLPAARRSRPAASIAGYRIILGDRSFVSAVIALGASLSLFLMWNVYGPFVVQRAWHASATVFGMTALGAGACYLCGTLLNRLLLRRVAPHRLMLYGLGASALGLASVISTPGSVEPLTLLSGVMLCNFGQGLLFSNVVAVTMKLHADRAGATASLMGCGIMLLSSISSAITGQVRIDSNLVAGALFAAFLGCQVLAILYLVRRISVTTP